MTIAARTLLTAALGVASLFAQKIEFADVQVSPKNPGVAFMLMKQPQGGRWEIRSASIVDLMRMAWGIDSDRIQGGPSWVEMDRFDIVAKIPDHADPETRNEMLKALLADRFKLVTHDARVPMPGFSLTAGKKPSMKPGDGSGDTGCRIQQRAIAPQEGGIVFMTAGAGGAPTRITLGKDGIIEYACRNMTMDSFVQGLRGMVGAGLGNKPVVNNTGLEGKWDFSLRLSILMNGAPMNGAERITIEDAVEKQMGLKLTEIDVPTPVIVIDSVERKPTPNPPGTAEALPPLKAAAAFDVATVRPSDPDARGGRMNWNANRVTVENMPLRTLLMQAFRGANSLLFSPDALVGMPSFAETAKFNITASSADGTGDPSAMMRALLAERFKLKWHAEDRPMDAYTLVAVRPKMKKADPASRSHCLRGNAPAGSPPGSSMLACQNITMDDLADQLMSAGTGNAWPVRNSTGIEGGWDFTLIYGRGPAPMAAGGEGRGGPVAEASDPSGTLTIFEAIEKQLGLKLQMEKRPEPVIVIDHLEEKPTGN